MTVSDRMEADSDTIYGWMIAKVKIYVVTKISSPSLDHHFDAVACSWLIP